VVGRGRYDYRGLRPFFLPTTPSFAFSRASRPLLA
jgi:hypothetical protein